MYWQVYECDIDTLAWLRVQPYGLVRKDEPHVVATTTPSAGQGGDVAVNVEAALGLDVENLYSNLKNDFTVTRTSATVLTLAGIPFGMTEENIVAVLRKPAGSTSSSFMKIRGVDLEVDYDQTNHRLTVPASFSFGATDLIGVWIEGPPRGYNTELDQYRARVENQDAEHVSTDGELINEQLDSGTYYKMFNMGVDGYHGLTAIVTVPMYATLTLEGTNDTDVQPGGWQDVTQEVFNAASFNNGTFQLIPTAGVDFRVLRWKIVCTEDDQTVIISQLRTALFNPNQIDTVSQAYLLGLYGAIATHNDPVETTGFHPMLDARSALPAAVATGDAARSLADLYGRIMNASHTIATRSDRMEEIDPLSQQYLGEEIDESSQGNGTNNYYFDVAGYDEFTIHWLANTAGSGTNTLTVAVTNQDDGTAPAACTYVDITNAWFGAASFTGIGYLERGVDRPMVAKYIRVRVVRTGDGGSTNGAWTIWTRKLY
jgi:hypothetical protein